MFDTPALTIPVIHLNGSGQLRLRDQYVEMAEAVRHALDTLYQNGPNARDYYPAGPDAWTEAQAGHDSRLGRLRSVLKELEYLAEAVAEVNR